MNTVTTNPGNGEARLYIDGVQVAQMTNLRYVLDLATKIDSFRFTTFFGGNSSDYAPDEPEYAYFDNFTVRSGLQITGQNGYGQQCEIWEEGIFNPSSDVCCAESCGACGGTGCSSLPGGSSSCCTGTIQSSGNWCNLTGVSAPCFFL